jgi:hypothetical protein
VTTNQNGEGSVGAVLAGKPNPFDFGAVPKAGGGYWWPAPDQYGRIKVHGKMLPKKIQIARYAAALADWNRRNAAYQQRVATSGPDPAMRAALRASQSQMAQQANRISSLEQQILDIGQRISSGVPPQDVSFVPDEWSDDGAYYYDPSEQAPGGYFDDDGGYGQFDGMSGADGDLGYVRRYGRGRMGYGRGFARPPSAYYSSVYEYPDPMYGEFIDDMMGPTDAHPDPASALSPPPGVDGVAGMEEVNTGNVGAVAAPRRPIVSMAHTKMMHAPINVPHHAPIRVPPSHHADRRDALIRNLTHQISQGRVDVAALSHELAEAGCIVEHETRRKEMEVAMRYFGDGVSGTETAAPANLGAVPSMPLPEPPPPMDDVGGADCGCGALPGGD